MTAPDLSSRTLPGTPVQSAPDGIRHRAALYAGLLRVLLSTLPWRVTLRLLRGVARPARTPIHPPPSPDAVAEAVSDLSRFVPRATCLVQAMTAGVLLGRSGRRVELVMGTPAVRGPSFEAHAWLECAGEVVVGGDVSRQAELVRIPLGAV